MIYCDSADICYGQRKFNALKPYAAQVHYQSVGSLKSTCHLIQPGYQYKLKQCDGK